MVFSSIILINNHRLVTAKTKKKQSSFAFLESSCSQHQVNSIASSYFLICPHLCITFHQPLQMALINIQPQKPSYEVLKLIDVSLLNKTPTNCVLDNLWPCQHGKRSKHQVLSQVLINPEKVTALITIIEHLIAITYSVQHSLMVLSLNQYAKKFKYISQ